MEDTEIHHMFELAGPDLSGRAPEDVFGRLAERMVHRFGVTVALINFVGPDLLHPRAPSGLTRELGPLPRHLTPCAQVVDAGRTVVVPDADAVAGWREHTFFSGCGCRFYAGAPIVTTSGHRLGTVCLLHRTPRRFSETDRRDLEAFAEVVSRELERRAPRPWPGPPGFDSAPAPVEFGLAPLAARLDRPFLNGATWPPAGRSVPGEHLESLFTPAPEGPAPTRDREAAPAGTGSRLPPVLQGERLKTLLMHHTPDLLTVHAPDGRLLYSNRDSGDADRLEVGEDGFEVILPEDRERVRDEGWQPALRGERTHTRWRWNTRSGVDRWMESSVVPVQRASGEVEYLLAVTRDITERQQREEETALLRSAVMAAGHAVLITRAAPIDLPGPEIIYVNEAFTRMTGFTPPEILGRSPRVLQGPGTDRVTLERIRQRLARGEGADETLLNYTREGRPFWAHLTITPLLDPAGRVTHWVSVQRDVTHERREQAFEQARREVLERVAAAEPLQDVLAALTGMLEQRFPDTTASLLLLQGGRLHEAGPSRLPPDYRQAVEGCRIGPNVGACGAAASLREPVVSSDLFTDPRWEAFRPVIERHGLRACWSVPVFSGNRTVVGTLALYHRVPASPAARELEVLEDTARLAAVVLERYRALDDQQRLSLFDSLTRLPNRTLFSEQLRAALNRRQEHEHVAVGLLDLNRFRAVNDSFGHDQGDQLLQEIAQRLGEALGGSGLLARMGGDEFALIVEQLPAAEHTEQVAQAVMQTLAAPFNLRGQEVFVSGSLGFAVAPADGHSGADLLLLAESAMYHAKQRALGWASLKFAPQRDARRSVALEAALHHALELRELELHYQPIVDPAGRVVAAEALLRWYSPALGSVSPDEFIPVAERTGQIIPIGAWVLERACLDGAALQRLVPGLRVAVNVSSKQFGQPQLAPQVRGALGRSGLAPELLTLEITESVLMDQEEAVRRVRELCALGVRLALDDFGTGFSSLQYLRELPIHNVKIDRLFVQTLQDVAGKDAQIVRAIAQLCQVLDLEVTAEGVENAQQAEVCRQLGINLMQGWQFARPMALDTLCAWLQQRPEAEA